MDKKEHNENQDMDQMVDQQERRGDGFTEKDAGMENREQEPQAGNPETADDPAPEEQAAAAESEGDALEAMKKDYQELKDKYLRLYAEFDNYKKRTIREKVELMTTAARDTMTALLPVLDDFDRAKKIAEDESTTETFSEGVRLVYNKLYNVLQQKGLEPMKSDGEPFDPELHEAFTEIPAPSEEMKGRVVDTIEKGYKLKDKIIRHAKVVVGK